MHLHVSCWGACAEPRKYLDCYHPLMQAITEIMGALRMLLFCDSCQHSCM